MKQPGKTSIAEQAAMTSVIFSYRLSHAGCQNSVDGVSRSRHHFSERVTILSRKFRKNKIRWIVDWIFGRDSQPHPRKILCAEFSDHRFQSVVAARCSPGPNPNPAEWKREIIA